MEEETTILMQCGQCENRAKLIVRAKYVQDEEDRYGNHYVTTWRILECPACFTLNLGKTYIDSEMYPYEDDEEHIVYPVPTVPTEERYLQPLPEEVDKAYKVALRVRDVPNAFAVLIGRTLETVCKHENATGKSLSDKLQDLAKNDRIPPTLAKMAHQLRALRNFGAHADDDEVRLSDVPIIKEFVEAILEYLYVAPSKIQKLQDRLDGKQETIDDNFDLDYSL